MYTIETIKATVAEIRNNPIKDVEKLRSIYFKFFESYPKLFAAAADPTFNLSFLDQMMETLADLDNKKVDLDAADKKIYGHLKSEYVDHLFPEEGHNQKKQRIA